ncbi:MAG TPA: LemA family protein [Candidatus Acidoferrales bacterium]|nr:LemA family protein [Candidatus Acidoferrales bacterium]
MKALIGVVVLLLLAGLIVGGSYVSSKNKMVTLNETIKSNWSAIDVDLQRRSDLIPNLVETVKGYAAQEQTVYDDIAKARAALGGARTPSEKISANGQLDSALSRLLVVVENYPQLKSNENFMRLQDELAGTENRISVARKRYNDALQAYNTFIGKWPNSIFAGWAGFHRNDAYFQAAEPAREVPKVAFPGPNR